MDESAAETYDEATEDFSPVEDVDASTIIIIHPGSRFLRLGLASDPSPQKMLHAIARRRKNSNPAYNRIDPFVIPKVNAPKFALIGIQFTYLKTMLPKDILRPLRQAKSCKESINPSCFFTLMLDFQMVISSPIKFLWSILLTLLL